MAETTNQPQGSTCCAPQTGVETSNDLPSAVDFATPTRPHVSLNVKSVAASLPFYRALFNQRPTKLKDDYAKWECAEPPINLAILETPDGAACRGHFGIEVKSTDEVKEFHDRLKQVQVRVDAKEENVACCYSVQTKIWAVDPDGNRWEVFVVTGDDTEEGCGVSCICYNPATGGCEWGS